MPTISCLLLAPLWLLPWKCLAFQVSPREVQSRKADRLRLAQVIDSEVEATRPSMTTGRRDWIRSTTWTGIGAFASTASPQPSFSLNNEISPGECQNGALVTESVVPGAYDQICMNLPTRTIPLEIPITNNTQDNSSATTRTISRTLLSIRQEGVGPGKTGLSVWNSALLLGRLLQVVVLENPTWLPQQRVAEVGCGAGLVSIMMAKWGSKSVWSTDGNPAAVALARSNFERNGIAYSSRAKQLTASKSSNDVQDHCVTELHWGELEVPLEWMGAVNVVVGSDLTYNSGSWRILAETMESLLAPNGVVIYLSLGHSGFNVRGELEGFVNVAKQAGLSQLSTGNLPFALPEGVATLDALLQSVVLPSEQPILAATGGAQVVVLGRSKR